jgi:hypothetical protein
MKKCNGAVSAAFLVRRATAPRSSLGTGEQMARGILAVAAVVALLQGAVGGGGEIHSSPGAQTTVTISNLAPRLDSSGHPVNAHSGNVVGPINGTYFLYGEWYGTGPYSVVGTLDLPRLSVYHSKDMVHWEFVSTSTRRAAESTIRDGLLLLRAQRWRLLR